VQLKASDIIRDEQCKLPEQRGYAFAVGKPSDLSKHPWANELREVLAESGADQGLINEFATLFDLALADTSRNHLTHKHLLEFARRCHEITSKSITFDTGRDGYVTISGNQGIEHLLTAGIQYSSDCDGTEVLDFFDGYCCAASLSSEQRDAVREILLRHARTYVYDPNIQVEHSCPDWSEWGDETPVRRLLAHELKRKGRLNDACDLAKGDTYFDPFVTSLKIALTLARTRRGKKDVTAMKRANTGESHIP